MSINSTTYKKVLSKGKESNLPEIEDGKLRFTTDTGKLFLDYDDKRIEISDLVKGLTRDQIINTENPLPRLYLSSDTNELYFYNQEWHSIGGGNASTADYAINAATANYAKDALYAQAASYSTDSGTSNYANSATNASTAYYAQNAGWADFAATANIASSALSSDNAAYANYADAATNAATADYSHNSGTSDRAINADYANWSTYSQDAIDTISRNATTFTVTRKDGSTFIFDQTDESVRQVEVNNSGNYELLLSSVRAGDNGTGETKKNHGVYLTPRDNLNGNRIKVFKLIGYSR